VVVAVIFARRLTPLPAADPAVTPGPAGRDRWGPFGLVTCAVLLRPVAFFGIITFLPLWQVRHLHSSKPAADAAVAAFMCAGIVGTLIGGRLADRYGRRPVAAIGLAAATPLLLAYLALAARPAAFWVASATSLTATLAAVSCVPVLAAIAPALLPAD
jgi:MFS transporter, FSR family, fosmidomycin resistance protein